MALKGYDSWKLAGPPEPAEVDRADELLFAEIDYYGEPGKVTAYYVEKDPEGDVVIYVVDLERRSIELTESELEEALNADR